MIAKRMTAVADIWPPKRKNGVSLIIMGTVIETADESDKLMPMTGV